MPVAGGADTDVSDLQLSLTLVNLIGRGDNSRLENCVLALPAVCDQSSLSAVGFEDWLPVVVGRWGA